MCIRDSQSIPVQGKKSDDSYEMFKIIQAMIERQSVKFDELKIDINEVKNKCDDKCNELKRDMKKVVDQ